MPKVGSRRCMMVLFLRLGEPILWQSVLVGTFIGLFIVAYQVVEK